MSRRSISTAPSPPQEADSTIQTIDALAELGASLSEQQIRQVVIGMRMTDGEKARLIAQALAGDPGARLVVFAAWKRTHLHVSRELRRLSDRVEDRAPEATVTRTRKAVA